MLSRCETFDADTGDSKNSNYEKGACIGVGIGIALAYVKNREKAALIVNKQ